MQPRADFHEDFGLSGLTRVVQSRFVPRTEAGCLCTARNVLEVEGQPFAEEVVEDVRRLTQSSLSDDVLSTLWLAATEARFDPVAAGLGIRAWLLRIADTCVACIREVEPSFDPAMPGPAGHPEIRDAVLAELRDIGPALAQKAVTSLYAPPLPALVPSLEEAVTELGPDLGFRLFLRAMKVYLVPIGPGRLDRYQRIGRSLGYNELVVTDGSLNIWYDLED
ncbi:hypothetical protein [Kitasatospora paranensis]|uniref:Uncharacterized protein n=1 Tax=Kitasatospora paranensis TaxID=258053 RepID=A0ABW2G3L6_9ACTN